MNTDEYVDVEFDAVLCFRPLAVCFQYGDKEQWVPKSCLEDAELVCEPPLDEPQTVAVAKWFARKEDLIYEDE